MPSQHQDNPSLSFEQLDPDPSAMVESMRAFGYSTESALADLIDNSITAGASTVWIDFHWNGQSSYVIVRDDGRGMTGNELTAAMRLGSKSPLLARHANDLGRFGLGLKTASFSQCRRLTVASRQLPGDLEVRSWDLDFVRDKGKWLLQKHAASGSASLLTALPADASGTVVLWEKLDQIVGESRDEDPKALDTFLELVERVEKHLAMIFHRLMEGARGVKLILNGDAIAPWDPFMESVTATQRLTPETLWLRGAPITVQPFVLPHRSKLPPGAEEPGGGPKGWTSQQGFYVYRNERLLVAGSWLGMRFRKDEPHKLARIRVDIGNTTDTDWQLDVKKSQAVPPPALRESLKRIAKLTRARASEVFRHRGQYAQRAFAAPNVFLWLRKIRHGKLFYEINREHPVLDPLLKAAAPASAQVRILLRMLEETVPVPTIMMDANEQATPHADPFEGSDPVELAEVVHHLYSVLIDRGMNPDAAKDCLAAMEPFRHFPKVLELLPCQAVQKGP